MLQAEVEAMKLSPRELARLAGVSVRTLHYYDEIGLLKPTERSASGYRRYDAAAVARLHRILVYRELGFELERIALFLDDPGTTVEAHLQRQRALLLEQLERVRRMLAGVEAMMGAKHKGYRLTPDELKEVFGGFDPGEHQAEAEARWGDTEAYRESAQRTARYGREEWEAIKAEAEAIEAGFAEALRRGELPDSGAALGLAEAHRQHISRWFYPCSHSMHRGLAELYVSDPRFAAHYDERAPGLGGFVRAAILANARGTGGGQAAG
jgi:DNA-binding transcriptional MerR regulator